MLGEFIIIESREIKTRMEHFPQRRAIQGSKDVQQRAFSRTTCANDADGLTLLNREIDASQNLKALSTRHRIGLRDTAGLEKNF